MSTNETDAWTALGDPSRRRIFQRLTERPRSVSELAAELPISRPAVSQHLRVLRHATLVRARTEGTRHIYEVDTTGLRALQADLDRFWGQALTNLKVLAEEQSAAGPDQKEQER